MSGGDDMHTMCVYNTYVYLITPRMVWIGISGVAISIKLNSERKGLDILR